MTIINRREHAAERLDDYLTDWHAPIIYSFPSGERRPDNPWRSYFVLPHPKPRPLRQFTDEERAFRGDD
jgi:hypothetical protein